MFVPPWSRLLPLCVGATRSCRAIRTRKRRAKQDLRGDRAFYCADQVIVGEEARYRETYPADLSAWLSSSSFASRRSRADLAPGGFHVKHPSRARPGAGVVAIEEAFFRGRRAMRSWVVSRCLLDTGAVAGCTPITNEGSTALHCSVRVLVHRSARRSQDDHRPRVLHTGMERSP
jgi:hypothetical protein